MDQTLQSSLLTSDDVAKGPRGTNVPMAVKFNPDGEYSQISLVFASNSYLDCLTADDIVTSLSQQQHFDSQSKKIEQ
jgi:hypothetical protein